MNQQEITDLLHVLGVTDVELSTRTLRFADRDGPTLEEVEEFARKIVQGRKPMTAEEHITDWKRRLPPAFGFGVSHDGVPVNGSLYNYGVIHNEGWVFFWNTEEEFARWEAREFRRPEEVP